MADEISTGGGSSINGVVDTAGGGFVGRDRPENNTVFNVGETLNNYTMSDLRLDLRFLKQEVDRLREDLVNSKSDGRDVNNRVIEIKREVEFLEVQVSNILLLKPVPRDAQTPSSWTLNLLTIVVSILSILTVLFSIYMARGH